MSCSGEGPPKTTATLIDPNSGPWLPYASAVCRLMDSGRGGRSRRERRRRPPGCDRAQSTASSRVARATTLAAGSLCAPQQRIPVGVPNHEQVAGDPRLRPGRTPRSRRAVVGTQLDHPRCDDYLSTAVLPEVGQGLEGGDGTRRVGVVGVVHYRDPSGGGHHGTAVIGTGQPRGCRTDLLGRHPGGKSRTDRTSQVPGEE